MQSTIKVKTYIRTPETRNGLIQMIWLDRSSGQKRLILSLVYVLSSADKVNSMTKEEMLSNVSDTVGADEEEYNKVLSR